MLVVSSWVTMFAKGAELKHSFPMREGSGQVIKDTVGKLSGKITGGTWKNGNLYLSGTGSYIDVPNSKSVSDTTLNGPCSVELWFKPDESKDYRKHQWLVGSGWDGQPAGFNIEYLWHVLKVSGGAKPQWSGIGAKGNFSLTDWNHLVMTVDDKGQAVLYVNGVDVKLPIKKNGKCKMVTSGEDLIFGGYPNHKDYQFKGGLAGIKIYKGALTAGEVNANYSKGMAVSKITLDGKLDDAIWKNATVFDTFYKTGGKSSKIAVQAKAYITADKDYTYGAVECFEPAMQALAKKGTKNGDVKSVYYDDCIEFMLDADGDPTCYYHFIINANGAHAQAYRIENGRITSPWPAEKLWKSVAKKYADKWIVEFAIPHAILSEGDKGIGKNPKVNFARNRRAGAPSESSILEDGGFHQCDFKAVKFPTVTPDKYLVRLGQKQLDTKQNSDGKLVVTVKTNIINNRKATARGTVNISFTKQNGDSASTKQAVTIKPGESLNIAVPVLLSKPGNYDIVTSFLQNNEVAAMRQFTTEQIKFVPLTIVLDKPFYRNNFYHTEQADEIIARIKVNLADSSGMKVNLTMKKGDEKIAAKSYSVKNSEATYKLPFGKNLPVGNYQFNVSVTDRQGTVLGDSSVAIRRLPKAPGTEVRINKNLTIMKDGKPYFPIYWSGHAPVNDGSTGRLIGWGNNAKQQLDKLKANGLYGTYVIWSSQEYEKFVKNSNELTDEHKAYLNKLINEAKGHPNMYAYEICDEPDSTPGLKDGFLTKVRNYIAEQDPYHPGIITNNSISGFSKYGGGQDISVPDPYPLFIKGGTSARGLDYQSYLLAEAYRAGKAKKALGICMQAFNYGDFTQPNGRAPSYVEFRTIFYNAAIRGAKSMYLWSWGKDRACKYPQLVVGTPYLFKEVKALAPAIMSGEVIVTSPIVKEGVDYRILKYNGAYYIIASNSGSKTIPVGIKLPAGCNATKLNIVSEGTAKVKDGVIQDKIAPFASKIYTTSNKYNNLTKLNEVKKVIEQAGGTYECKY